MRSSEFLGGQQTAVARVPEGMRMLGLGHGLASRASQLIFFIGEAKASLELAHQSLQSFQDGGKKCDENGIPTHLCLCERRGGSGISRCRAWSDPPYHHRIIHTFRRVLRLASETLWLKRRRV